MVANYTFDECHGLLVRSRNFKELNSAMDFMLTKKNKLTEDQTNRLLGQYDIMQLLVARDEKSIKFRNEINKIDQ